MVLLHCKVIACCAQATQETDWVTVFSSVGAVLVGIFAIIFSYFQFKKSLDANKSKEQRDEIYKKLNDFYGPLLQLRKKSSAIYKLISGRFKEKDPNFRVLTYLLEGNSFDGNDNVLVKEIISLGEQSERLIHEKAGLIDDARLRTSVIPRATTHFLILRLAYNKALEGDSHKFHNLTFPRELDELLEKRRKELEEQLRELNK
jgi:hypothetical protein